MKVVKKRKAKFVGIKNLEFSAVSVGGRVKIY